MAKKTWHDRIVDYMLAHNYKPLPFRGTKFKRFGLTVNGEKYRTYLVGKNGGVQREIRYTNSDGQEVLTSTSVTELFKRYVERWENDNGKN